MPFPFAISTINRSIGVCWAGTTVYRFDDCRTHRPPPASYVFCHCQHYRHHNHYLSVWDTSSTNELRATVRGSPYHGFTRTGTYTSRNTPRNIYLSRFSRTARGCRCTTACFALRTVQRRPESSNEVLFDDRRETSRRRPLTAPRVTTPVVPWTLQGNNHHVRRCQETSTVWG